jgi:hypothetical protein
MTAAEERRWGTRKARIADLGAAIGRTRGELATAELSSYRAKLKETIALLEKDQRALIQEEMAWQRKRKKSRVSAQILGKRRR